ncbi:UDP-N-acetylmuramyl pentapeptide phosphotransferase/UDP-N-acetylglucosamine-1-phosphate transferase [Pedobacter steynii]|uniref:UDP-N-acetylmuramyl pentapeptide phosphotransferase/UDP-N-acetylglucosamine-1-phosphate transferase n=1 Tax=Pedobacter steynii TaxID=430522 RepID=A0A1G9WKH0_9SPHI|nr:glycosyltransferase family 4 protein [Pedobacter steynii]NQX40316.1 glycosyltransferase family 4 protein [Pedobacter steynii]SDM84661.1 UDP-N-acetylmuramyl pentapeptide phosphotransferase/UDP-N-acetylglucosamine-1-phosphate transferase [Pedobacter steynii]
MLYLILLCVFFLVMLLYFKIADHYNIIDHPNERSSHSEITIRGGGVIFLFAGLIALFLHPTFWMPILGLYVIGIISFIDDRITLSGKVRIVFHLTAVTLLFISLSVFQIFPWWQVLILYVLVIGIINAYNFMDGINGITGTYSLVILGGLQYVNYNVADFIHVDLIWLPIIASVVFLFFNFRKKAKCFAGDVGSVTMAFWIIFLLIKLILQTENYAYVLFLAVYGVDTVLTIIHRLKLRHNIFDAHRLHFYQILANEQKWSQLLVALIYSLLQLGIIVAVIFSSLSFPYMFLITTVPLVVIYSLIKPRIMIRNKM